MKRSRAPLAAALCLLLGAAAAAQEPKVAGKDVPAPKRTKTVAPEYPPEAIAQGLRGIVILELLIDTRGHVASVDVVRSVPPFDAAAIAAAKKWEYEVTRVDGKPVSVLLSVPITFALKLPEVTRQEGIPELRQGAEPRFPPGATGGSTASVTVSVTLERDGRVAEAQLVSGNPPWAEALLAAVRTWRFAPAEDDAVISFRVQADFAPGGRNGPGQVILHLSGLQRSETLEPAPPPPAATVLAETPPAAPGPSPAAHTEEPAAAAPEPSPTPVPASPAPVASPASVVSPAPPAAPPPTPAPPPTARATTEVVPAPAAALPPPPAPTLGVSAVEHVTLKPGVPDLVRGRRPLVPPFARMAEASGTVSVRFSVDAAGRTSVQTVDGPDLLKGEAEQAVGTWIFRRVTAERLYLAASFTYAGSAASATVEPQQ